MHTKEENKGKIKDSKTLKLYPQTKEESKGNK
jgi:hypothetical protein